MDKIKEIQEKVNNCLHCGQKPKVYHQDYIGDSYVGDEYCIECDCGISTHFDKDEAVLKIWNSKAPISCDDGMDNKKWVEKAKRTGTILWNKLYDDDKAN